MTDEHSNLLATVAALVPLLVKRKLIGEKHERGKRAG